MCLGSARGYAIGKENAVLGMTIGMFIGMILGLGIKKNGNN